MHFGDVFVVCIACLQRILHLHCLQLLLINVGQNVTMPLVKQTTRSWHEQWPKRYCSTSCSERFDQELIVFNAVSISHIVYYSSCTYGAKMVISSLLNVQGYFLSAFYKLMRHLFIIRNILRCVYGRTLLSKSHRDKD